jgi:hypothetical protein
MILQAEEAALVARTSAFVAELEAHVRDRKLISRFMYAPSISMPHRHAILAITASMLGSHTGTGRKSSASRPKKPAIDQKHARDIGACRRRERSALATSKALPTLATDGTARRHDLLAGGLRPDATDGRGYHEMGMR